MKTVLNWTFTVALAALVFPCAGCRSGLTTALVWQVGEYHPAHLPRLQLSTVSGTNDLLVQYDECFEKSKTIRPRAYWLFTYSNRDTNSVCRPKPKFVNPERIPNLAPIKMLCGPDVATNSGYCVRKVNNPRAFELWRDGAEVGSYRLPVYTNAPPTTWGRVALTPVTVTTDTAIVATALIIIGAGGCSGGCP